MQKFRRVPIIDKDKCKPNKCKFECGLICPVNQQGKQCIELVDIEDIGKKKRIAKVYEDMCVSCSACSGKRGCPFKAIQMVNIPTMIEGEGIHRYGPNGFRLYRMPIIKPNQVTGLLGQNGIGKSTIVNIIANKMKPNFEKNKQLTDQEIIASFKGNEMHKYMTRLYNNELKVTVKPQHVDKLIPYLKSRKEDPTVYEYLIAKSADVESLSTPFAKKVINDLELEILFNSKVLTLSGGELQRLICASVLLTKSDVYIFDEPTNYLDIKKRLTMANLINELVAPDTYILVIEHDLTILDYTTDSVCIMYGQPSAYGIVSQPFSTLNAINTYFEGYIASENMRFREAEYSLVGINTPEPDILEDCDLIKYPGGKIEFDNFSLTISDGMIPAKSSIIVILGENGTGKTTMINYLAKYINTSVSHKPQYLSIEQFVNKDGTYPTVDDFFYNSIMKQYIDPMFITDVVKPMTIDKIKDRRLDELSGGELQRVFIVKALGTESHFYLIDEPSSNLDIEQRVIVTKVLKRFAVHNKKILFVVEHDMMVAVSLGVELNTHVVHMDILNTTNNLRQSIASSPSKFDIGINHFLRSLNITFRTEKESKHTRPRINKMDSVKDREQKAIGKYY